MAWTFHELPDSRSFTVAPDTWTLKYVAGRSGSETYIKALAISGTPAVFNGLYRTNIDAKSLKGGMWHVDVSYEEDPPLDPNSYRIRYDTTGGTAHVTQAKEHLDDYGKVDEDPPDHGGAINVKEDGRPEGTDIVVSAFKWTEEHTLAISVAGWPYSQVVKAISGKTNEGAFRGFPAGRVLFHGATGSYSSELEEAKEIQMVYTFESQDDLVDVTFDEITLVDKEGWEYIWFEHEQDEDTDANTLKSPLLAVHRERMYDPADFGLLLIGS